MRLTEQFLELVNVFKEASNNFIGINFSLELDRLKTLKPFAQVLI